MPKAVWKSYIGCTFGKLTVLRRDDVISDQKRQSFMVCQCECGNTPTVRVDHLRRGAVISCGCAKRKHVNNTSDNLPEYQSWNAMRNRCLSRNSEHFEHYGGRGISICSKWVNSFDAFLSDVGVKPTPEHTLGRIDNDKGYEPGNVRWEDRDEQSYNKRNTKFVTWEGKEVPFGLLIKTFGIPWSVAYQRYYLYGWSLEDTLNTPKGPGRRTSAKPQREQGDDN